jgi:hypothetical protein
MKSIYAFWNLVTGQNYIVDQCSADTKSNRQQTEKSEDLITITTYIWQRVVTTLLIFLGS